MKKFKITFEIDMNSRKSIGNTLSLLKRYINLLNEKWKKSEVNT